MRAIFIQELSDCLILKQRIPANLLIINIRNMTDSMVDELMIYVCCLILKGCNVAFVMSEGKGDDHSSEIIQKHFKNFRGIPAETFFTDKFSKTSSYIDDNGKLFGASIHSDDLILRISKVLPDFPCISRRIVFPITDPIKYA